MHFICVFQWGLAVSRSFGDLPLKEPYPLVSASPDLSTYGLVPKKDRLVLLASDGIFDVMSDEQALRAAVIVFSFSKIFQTLVLSGWI